MGPAEVFLSHSDKNRDIVGAQQWHDEIGSALRRCDWFAIVLSPESVESIWVKRELLFALQDNRYENKIVPILHRPCTYADLSWTLYGFQFIDATGDFNEACRQLFRVWGIGFRPPT